jgi:hypothetical protein
MDVYCFVEFPSIKGLLTIKGFPVSVCYEYLLVLISVGGKASCGTKNWFNTLSAGYGGCAV